MRLLTDMIGKTCVVRSRGSGVWLGELQDAEDQAVTLHGARRAWQWTGALTCSELATLGPTGGKIGTTTPEVVVFEVLEVIPAADKAIEAWRGVPETSGR